MLRRAGWILWATAAVPVLLALLYLRPTDAQSPGAVLNLLGRLTGIAGLACLLVAAAVSCRVPGFDRPFGGLTKLWKAHHELGAASFLLLLAHPLLLALGAAEVSLAAAAETLVPRRLAWGALWGWLTLLAMMVFLAPSFKFFGEPEYQRWRNIHRLAAVAVIAGLAHTFLLARTMAEPWNTLIWAALAAVSVAAVAYRLVFSHRSGRLVYDVAGIARPANNIVELTLEPRGARLAYEPGQFVYLAAYDRALTAGYAEEHPYTLSSSPDEPRLRIAIKDLGDASRAIQNISNGAELRIEGPYGAFFTTPEPQGAEIWIAGGIGITPFLGRARWLADRAGARSVNSGSADSARPDPADTDLLATNSATEHMAESGTTARTDIVLVYCVQDESRAHFLDELRELEARIPGFRLVMHYFYHQGPLQQAFLLEHCPGLAGRNAYVCGPLPLLAIARASLIEAGTARERIHSEEFTLL